MRLAPLFSALFAAATPALAEPLKVQVQDLTVEYEVFFAPMIPGEVLDLQVMGRPSENEIRFDAPDRGEALEGEMKLAWKAPDEPGHYPLTITDETTGDRFTLNVLVGYPKSDIEDGALNGYKIGQYEEQPLRGQDTYLPPEGFIEVSEETKDVQVSPHFRLGQFICKQETDAEARYVVLRPELLLKLEQAVDLIQDEGFDVGTLYVMSGYRTPWYNKAIGNTTSYSRHLYGDAADVFVDIRPKNGVMDDLNGDGTVDKADANHLYDAVERMASANTEVSIKGGIGSYAANAAHGPFVHIDTRGTPARWGR
ncbi:D-Ala-D-Ala carboxypeptidase family metallohydrolase [Parvularcula maris]|uniref:D-Ala-D-Ala carboxypeptidase family metallohydrolase n=1 Tax=Parvularcula maris TaxID=2965077 RepID=A0A9X2L6Z4_9PROT|nr:D-Ala-D-Ala carboxypeptidase family metallohydrolase [Parvularcula maris]MCQ8184123.1 D-Ala-D-Ala carboxypeptidase family metallohydrolase [Parvularcula maris]